MKKTTIKLEEKIYQLRITFREWEMLEDVLEIESFLSVYEKMTRGLLSMKESLYIILFALRADYPELTMNKLKEIFEIENWNSEKIVRKAAFIIRDERMIGEKEDKKKDIEKKN